MERFDVENVKMKSDQLWQLENGFRLKINETPESFNQTFLEINLDANKIEKNFRPPETISFWGINDYIKNLEDSGFSVKKHQVYKNYLYSFPLILLSMVLLGCILSIKKERIKKNVIKIIYGILIGVIFHFLSDIIKTLGQSGSLNIFLSVWSTPIIFNLLLISTLIHLEDG